MVTHYAIVASTKRELFGNKIGAAKLGGNATASVSAAVLIAGAMSLGIPLYQHVGGVNACTLPVPGAEVGGGNTRYGHGEGGGDKSLIGCG